MEWQDTGIVLAARRHGESGLILDLLTAEHGRHAGLVRGGQSPRRRALFQTGNSLAVVWHGRLAEQLGSYDCELLASPAAGLLDDPDRLAALNAAVALLLASVPEREPYPEIFTSLGILLETVTENSLSRTAGEGGSGSRPGTGEGLRGNRLSEDPHPPAGGAAGPPSPAVRERVLEVLCVLPWAMDYVRWECALLGHLGYGLDLTRCAATGATANLTHVSPRTGRAVSAEAAAPYRDKLLPLPPFLTRDTPATPEDIVAGLNLTRHFLLHHLLLPQGGRWPEARERFAERMRRYAASGMVARNQ